MEKSSVIKTMSCVLILLGIVTAGVCIWVIADPVKFGIIIQISLESGDSPKIGISAAVLMIVVGIFLLIMNSEGQRFYFFAGALVIILALSIAFMSVAIKDHQDLKKVLDLLKNVKNIIPPNIGLDKIGLDSFRTIENTNINMQKPDAFLKPFDRMMARMKAVAAVGGIDSLGNLYMLICLGLLFKYRP